MADDQGDKRSNEDKNGAGKTLLGDMLLAAQAARDAQQLTLLPADEGAAQLPGPRRPGRPPGARNKATEELRAWARTVFGDPGLKLLELAFADPAEIATRMGGETTDKNGVRRPLVTPWDVQVKQAEWLGRLLPYFWALMPAELKLQTTRHLALSISATPTGQAGDREMPLDPIAALLEFQGLSDRSLLELHAEQSHAEPTSDDTTKG